MVCNQFLILTRAGFSTPSIASITDAVIASHDVLTLRIRVTCVGLQITLIDIYNKVKVSHVKHKLKNQVSHIHVVLSVVLLQIWCVWFFFFILPASKYLIYASYQHLIIKKINTYFFHQMFYLHILWISDVCFAFT